MEENDGDDSRSRLVVVVPDGGPARRRRLGLASGHLPRDPVVCRSPRSCDLGHARPHCLSCTGTGCLSGDADHRIMGTVAVDSLDAIGRNHGAGAGRLLLTGTHSIVGTVESLAASVARIDPTDVSLASGGSATLR